MMAMIDCALHLLITRAVTIAALLLLLVCRISAQDGGCNPDPPNTLLPSGPVQDSSRKNLLNNNVPIILLDEGVPDTLFRPLIGGYGTDTWVAFRVSG